MIQLNYRDARPIYTQIADGFRDQILAGILQPNEQLPSVRELAAQLAINPNTIQRAYRELEVQGWVASVPGKGSFVCPRPDTGSAEQQAMLQAFDQAVQSLIRSGYPKDLLIHRLQEGGNRYD